MKNVIKIISFSLIFIILFYALSFVFLPNYSIQKFGLFKTSQNQILCEKLESIDVIFLGDSLVYSSVSPMEIYKEYGFTSYDVALKAVVIQDVVPMFEVAVESQKPKVVFIEANMFFRDIDNRPFFEGVSQKITTPFPLTKHHDNWKKIFSNNNSYNESDIYKGYKKDTTLEPAKNEYYMDNDHRSPIIPEENYEYIDRLVEISRKHNAEIVFLGLPSQIVWNNKKDEVVTHLAEKYNVRYINLNLVDDLNIDWTTETRDKGDHVNHDGAKKVSLYIAKYLNDNFTLEDHRNSKEYKEWNHTLDLYENEE